MSKDLIGFLSDNLKPHLRQDNSFSPAIQEEFLDEKGWLDKGYILKLTKLHMSTASFVKAIKQVFGTSQFLLHPVEADMTSEEFAEIYKFGEFPNARSWISFVYHQTGKVVSREIVFNTIINYKHPNNGIRFWAGGLRKIKQDTVPRYSTQLFS